MTELLYQTDSYLHEFEAIVTEVVGDGVVLAQTAFYPGGGGQPCDVGRMASDGEEWEVIKIGRSEGRIVHQLNRDPPPVGTSVKGILDWEHRYGTMAHR
jgi:misacylated tRNA(Ala) deacylase